MICNKNNKEREREKGKGIVDKRRDRSKKRDAYLSDRRVSGWRFIELDGAALTSCRTLHEGASYLTYDELI